MRRLETLQLHRLFDQLPWRGFKLLRAWVPLATVGMEFCWLYPWILMLTGLAYGPTAFPLLRAWPVLGLLLLGDLTVSATRRTLPLAWARAVVVGSGVCAGLLAVKHTYYPTLALWQLGWMWDLVRAAHDALPVIAPSVLASLGAAGLWWRGVVLGGREATHEETERAFQRGVGWSVMFVLIMALYGSTPAFGLTASAVSYLLAFLALGLIAMAVARLVGIWEESHADNQQVLAMNRHWLALVVVLVGAMLLAATLLSTAVGVDVWVYLSPLLEPLLPVVEVIFAILFAIAAVLARAILLILSRLRIVQPPARTPMGGTLVDELFRRLQALAVPPQVSSSARWGMVLVGVLVLGVLIALAVVRARRSSRPTSEDERESVWSVRAALSNLAEMWRALWPWGHRTASEVDDPAVATMRMLYRRLLDLAAACGFPRPRWQTPYEFLQQLRRWIPERGAESAVITEAYVRVRYARHTPVREELEEVEAAVELIRKHVDADR